ncbi:LysM peptidoglycan-binding domain-containing protein [Psychrobacillus sp.]|uniref:LysM peptidoglycan-binding domain-containing protein n=1 Tax=Psychrobacillus sp. TaxID=1871623 RepID=UPI0028BD2F34|nr:LysM peptidoglycan-binding domain-containing protein [Psychrobacillus sp.]
MSQDDYQKKIDEHRQKIGTEDNSMESRSSRRTKSSKKPKKKSKSLLLPSIFFVFIMIPVCILVYVQFFYTPEKEEVAEQQEIIQVETKNISNKGEDEEDTAEVEAETPVTTEPEKEEPVVEEPPVEEPKVEEPIIETKKHEVKEGETLYRIAMNYYKTPDAVEKIKDANGLRSDSISAGQKLILP